MPALIPTDFTARVTWIGVNRNRDDGLRTDQLRDMELSFAGMVGEIHSGLTRPSDSRVVSQHPKGTEIANTRQLSVVSEEELAEIAARMGLEALDPALIGASMALRGIPDFSHVPPSSRLQDEQTGATLVVDMENRPCMLPAQPIEAVHPGSGKAFKAAAAGRRGVTAWVEREGRIALGATLRLHIPDQPVWSRLDAARGALSE